MLDDLVNFVQQERVGMIWLGIVTLGAVSYALNTLAHRGEERSLAARVAEHIAAAFFALAGVLIILIQALSE